MKRFFAPEQTKVIFFDMNHTLIDPHQSFYDSFLDVLNEYTGRWSGDGEYTQQSIVERYWDEWRKKLTQKRMNAVNRDKIRLACLKIALDPLPFTLNEAFLRTFLSRIKDKQTRTPTLVPGARDTLEKLAETYKLAIISNGNKEKVESQLRILDLSGVIPGERVFATLKGGARKPNPALFRQALQSVGVAPSQAVMVGNSWKNDVLGAVGAGIDAVWLHPGHSKKSSQRKLRNRKVIIVRKIDMLLSIF